MGHNFLAKFTFKKMPSILTVEMSIKSVKKKKKNPRAWVPQLSLFYKPIKKKKREMEMRKFARAGV